MIGISYYCPSSIRDGQFDIELSDQTLSLNTEGDLIPVI